MTQEVRAWMLLAREQQVVPLAIGARIAEGALRRDTYLGLGPHLEQVRHVEVFGLHPVGDARVVLFEQARDVQVVVGAVPAALRHVGPAFERELDLCCATRRDHDLAARRSMPLKARSV